MLELIAEQYIGEISIVANFALASFLFVNVIENSFAPLLRLSSRQLRPIVDAVLTVVLKHVNSFVLGATD